MRRIARFLAVLLALAGLIAPLSAEAEVSTMARMQRQDDRAVLRAQIETELKLRRARLAAIEAELKEQAKRYDEMAKHKMALAKIADAKADAAREAAEEKALKAQYAAAQAGPKPAGKGTKGKAKDAKAADAAGDAKEAAGGGKDAGGAKGGDAKGAKRIDPMLTQNFLVLRLRDETRQLLDRITYLEGVLAKL
jgi:hypothetical protein